MSLIRELKSLPNNPKELIIVIIFLVLTVDLMLKGKFGIINLTMKYVKMMVKPASWQYMAIVLLILFKR